MEIIAIRHIRNKSIYLKLSHLMFQRHQIIYIDTDIDICIDEYTAIFLYLKCWYIVSKVNILSLVTDFFYDIGYKKDH